MARVRLNVWLAAALVALAQASLAKAGGPPHAHNWEPTGPVLGGVDVVAYHGLEETQTAVMGREQHAYRLPSSGYNYTFYFSTAANRDEFARDPWRYAPRLGGFCLYGMANEWCVQEKVLQPRAHGSGRSDSPCPPPRVRAGTSASVRETAGRKSSRTSSWSAETGMCTAAVARGRGRARWWDRRLASTTAG